MNIDPVLKYSDSAGETATSATAEACLGCSFEVAENHVKEKCSLKKQEAVCGDDDEACYALEYSNRRDLKETAKDFNSKDESIDELRDHWQQELPTEVPRPITATVKFSCWKLRGTRTQ